jgi:hypothetical protein
MAGSVVVITFDGTDISHDVEYAKTTFQGQLNAVPGTFDLTVRDPNRTHSFTTGKEVTLTIDGVQLYGGYATQVTRRFALPVDDTSNVSAVKSREWNIQGVDYNILFDKLVLRNTADYLQRLPTPSLPMTDQALIELLCSTYLDIPSGFDTTTDIEAAGYTYAAGGYPWLQQGSTWRQQMESIGMLSGALWYLRGNKHLQYRLLENVESSWGFSDVPNKRAVTGASGFQGATYGFRELDLVEDGSLLVNDAFVWGGNEFTGGTGGTVFSRYSASDSITAHKRWQYAETHFGDTYYASQTEVDNRAKVIVNGSPTALQPGAVDQDSQRGLRFTQWNAKLTWFAQNVPQVAGVPQHLTPGDLVTLIFYVMGTGATPLITELPLRTLNISFEGLTPEGNGIPRFDGYFGLQLSDPWTLWRYLLRNRTKIVTTVINTSSSTTTTYVYGSIFQDAPTPNPPDGTTRVFSIPVGYIAGTTQFYLNGILQSEGSGPSDAYSESDPANGEITLNAAPAATDKLWLVCRTLGA